MKTPVAILASGKGSNFEAIVIACITEKLFAKIVVLISENPNAPVVALAKKYSVPVEIVEVPNDSGLKGDALRAAHEEKILQIFKPLSPHFLIMAGYKRIVTERLLGAFKSERGYHRIANIHPSLLPSFPGIDAYQQAFDYGAKVSGVTVHLVDLTMDSGPICAQEAFSITDCNSVEAVEKRGLAIEHRLFPQTLRWVLSESFDVEEKKGRLCVRPH